MNILFIFLFVLFLDFNGSQTPVKGLKALYEFPAGSHIGYCDLSHQQLKTMPNLSMYHMIRWIFRTMRYEVWTMLFCFLKTWYFLISATTT